MRLHIEKIIYPGRSLGRDDGKIVFTDNGLTGETVEVEIIKEKKNYQEGKTREVFNPSPWRVNPRCGHSIACSPYQYIDYPHQLQIKQAQFEEIFSRFLAAPCPELTIAPSPLIWEYRNKLRLAVAGSRGNSFLAYHLPGQSDKFLAVEQCFLAAPGITRVLQKAIDWIRNEKLTGIKEISARQNRQGDLQLTVFLSEENYKPVAESLGRLNHPQAKEIWLVLPDGKKIQASRSEKIFQENLAGVTFIMGPQSFFQINLPQTEKLIADMKKFLSLQGNEIITDMFCGVGTLGLTLAPAAREVIGIEADKNSFPFLKENIRINQAGNFSAVEGKSEDAFPGLTPKPAIAIIDPPRKGLEARLCGFLSRKGPGRLVYISCDPVTLMRDLKILLAGYSLRRIKLYDFFPHTPHFESMVLLEKK